MLISISESFERQGYSLRFDGCIPDNHVGSTLHNSSVHMNTEHINDLFTKQ